MDYITSFEKKSYQTFVYTLVVMDTVHIYCLFFSGIGHKLKHESQDFFFWLVEPQLCVEQQMCNSGGFRGFYSAIL